MAITLTPVDDSRDQPPNVRWIIHDISERKRIEAQTRNLNAELEMCVRDRTAELEMVQRAKEEAYLQERQAREEAERANALKLQFLGMISHELRTPLQSIKGFASTLLAEDVVFEAQEQHEFMVLIDQEADNLTELINQLLNITQLKAGSLAVVTEPTALADIFDHLAAELNMLTRNHRLTLNLSPHLPPVFADSRRVAQTLTNLVGNAVKFSPVATEIAIAAHAEAGNVRICVRDEGPGIPEAQQALVFEPFQQLGNRQGLRRGVGLGLAICKELVTAHGGEIWFAPRGKPGTTICFAPPLAP